MPSSDFTWAAPKPIRPAKKSLPATDVQRFRESLERFQKAVDERGRRWADAKWGVYCFYDYDGEPIYVGQTNEQLRTRIRRHLTNQRTDAVAMRILDVFEVAEVEVWPLWDLEGVAGSDATAKKLLDGHEYSAYLGAIEKSQFSAILNEKIPPISPKIPMPPSLRWQLVDDATRVERGHPDIRIARRAETLSRLAAVARERGEVTDGLRRVIVVQAIRLAHIAAARLAYTEGREPPAADVINMQKLVGSILFEKSGPQGEDSNDEDLNGE